MKRASVHGQVLITDAGFQHLDIERALIEGAGFELRIAQCRTAEDVVAAAQEADALLVQWAPIDRAVIARLPAKLKVIVRYGIGVDNVDVAAAAARGIAVCNVPDYCVDEVADHTLALALALARRLPQTQERLRAGEWKIVPPGPITGWAGATFACAGFGRIARAVLRRAAAFGCRLAAYDPYVKAEEFEQAGVRPLSRDELFVCADVLSLHLPLNDGTRRFVDASRLAAMRPSAVLVNTSRGGLVDGTALAAALAAGSLAGAGLDVFEEEPLPPGHPLRHAPNALLTSHTAWFSNESVPRLQHRAAEEIVRGLLGQPLLNRVNR